MKKGSMRVVKVLASFMVMVTMMFGMQVFANAEGWTQKANMPIPAQGLCAENVNGKIYTIGGFSTFGQTGAVNEYNPVDNTWRAMTDMPTGRNQFATCVYDSKIYAIGGWKDGTGGLKTLQVYNPTANTWDGKPDMPTARYELQAAQVGQKIYAMGGVNNINHNQFDMVEQYDIATNTWSTGKAPMPTGVCSAGTVVIDNKIYVVGGVTYMGASSTTARNTLQVYDPATDSWTQKATMPSSRYMAGVQVINNKIYVVGGRSVSTFYKSVERYDIATNTWETLSNADSPVELTEFGTASYNNKIYTFGGWYCNRVNTVYEYLLVSAPSAPINLSATLNASNKASLTWTASEGAVSYNVKRATTAGGTYTTVATDVTATTYTDTTVTAGNTYYYVVTAVNTAGENTNSNEASITIPVPQPQDEFTGNNAIITVTMVSGLEKEYDVTIAEARNFLSWYNTRAAGTGKAYYMIKKNFNVGPFANRIDYLVFEKIECFEICDYNK